VIAYSPLAQGFLTGRYSPSERPRNLVRRRSKLFRAESFARGRLLLEALAEIASAHDCTAAQIALAWTIRSASVVAIPGASSVEQLESNAAAADLELSEGEIEALDRAAASFEAAGGASA